MRSDFLPVNEIFHSWQGEGVRTGEKSHFIRLSGCNVDCWFCDTETSDHKLMTVREIVCRVSELEPECGWVVLTGGEPLIHDQVILEKLIIELRSKGYRIQLETNGTIVTEIDFDHITVSPKRKNIVTGLDPNKISEVKVLTKSGDTPKRYLPNTPHFLQPIDSPDERDENIRFCEKFVSNNPKQWKLSLQMHKIWGIK